MVVKQDVIILAGKRYTINTLLQETDEYVRLEAAERCFALTALINDASVLVRCAVARKKYGHDTLVYDAAWQVRAIVAQYCSESRLLDILSRDEHDFVRFIVAKRGYALELLAKDQDVEIAAIARHALHRQQARQFLYS